jgi:DNA modification methylase
VRKCREIIESNPGRNWIIWCELEDERREIEEELLGVECIWGSQNIEVREAIVERFAEGQLRLFGTKPSLSGSGSNFQEHCHSNIFLGLGYKFADFIQSIHRTQRFGQIYEVDVHLIYTESEDPVHDALMAKWKQHDELHATMAGIIKEFGLNQAKANTEMHRSIGIERREAKGDLFTAVNNDNVLELQRMADASVDLVVTSWPFSDHYEYTESYNDFGHNDGDVGFFEQMEYLTPEVMRVLAPGRMYCVHAKDRIVYGTVSGDGMYTVNPFSDKCVEHLRRHGFRYCGRITVVTDVVRENNQTYRLGWTENSKDGTKMGVGSPEYVLLFRKLPTDTTNAYADVPVPHEKPLCETPLGIPIPFEPGAPMIAGTGYSRSRWQLDAHSFWRSNGNRFLRPEEIAAVPMDQLRKLWHEYSRAKVYDFGEHVNIAEEMEKRGILPSSFMALDPPNPGAGHVWDDVTRMKTLNSEQARKGYEMHVCPLQLDIVERLIERYSAPGELVLDPFGGLGTVAYCAVLAGRRGYTVELNSGYWSDSVAYCRGAEQKVSAPTLFDLMGDGEAA